MKPDTTAHQATTAAPDYRLILASLEKKAMAGEDLEKTQRILANDRIWKALAPDQQMHWATLAQMCGQMETALAVLDHVTRTNPKTVRAWRDRISLLLVLDRRQEAARLMALARQQVGRAAVEGLSTGAPQSAPDTETRETQPDAFDHFRRRERQIANYMALFSGREDAFARQWADRGKATQGYAPVRRPLTPADVADHLKGRYTYGIYLLRADSNACLGVIDADLATDFRKGKQTAEARRQIHREKAFMISRLNELSGRHGHRPLVEFSGGKGFHFWYFFQQPVAAGRIRALLAAIAGQVAPDLSAFNLEVFPKQDQLGGKGFGNLVKLPLGIHRVTGKPSVFVGCAQRGLDAQLDFLQAVSPAAEKSLVQSGHRDAADKVVLHPRWRQWAHDYPELAALSERCAPLGQIIALCREGKTPAAREERVLFQTVGLLDRAKTLMHHLYAFSRDYNPHWVDFRLSRLRGTPLGCRRIHSLLNHVGDMCVFTLPSDYPHPLLHIDGDNGQHRERPSEKATDLNQALDNLKAAMERVRHFMT